MDIIIVLSGLAGFIQYFNIKIIIFRLLHGRGIMTWVTRAFLVSSVMQTVVIVYYLNLIGYHANDIILTAILSLVVTALLVFCYVLAIFGLSTTSLRIQILIMMYQNGDRGIEISKLAKKYSQEIIVRERLARFLDSGEIIVRNGEYTIGMKRTFFSRFTDFLVWLNRIYGNKIYDDLL